jgi:hypothetical protein
VGVLKVGTAVAAVAATAEVGARVLGDRLPEPVVWAHPTIQAQAEQIQRLEAEGRRVDLVLLGNSITYIGVDPGILDTYLPDGMTSYNAAVGFGTSLIMEQWWPYAVDALHPRVVVYPATPTSMNDTSSLDAISHDRARLTQPGPAGDVRRFLTGHSEALSRAEALLDADNRKVLVDRLRGKSSATFIQKIRRATGPAGNRRPLRPVTDEVFFEQMPEIFDRFVCGGIKSGAYERTLRAVAATGVEVIVARFPISPRGRRLYEEMGGDPWGEGTEAILRAAEAAGAGVVDLSEGYADDQFSDPLHAGPGAVEEISRRLGQELARYWAEKASAR